MYTAFFNIFTYLNILLGSNSMELAGDIIHSLANYLGLEDLGRKYI